MQGITTAGGCRYRQAIPVGSGGRLDIDSNFGIRKAFLPQVRYKLLHKMLNFLFNHMFYKNSITLVHLLINVNAMLR